LFSFIYYKITMTQKPYLTPEERAYNKKVREKVYHQRIRYYYEQYPILRKKFKTLSKLAIVSFMFNCVLLMITGYLLWVY